MKTIGLIGVLSDLEGSNGARWPGPGQAWARPGAPKAVSIVSPRFIFSPFHFLPGEENGFIYRRQMDGPGRAGPVLDTVTPGYVSSM